MAKRLAVLVAPALVILVGAAGFGGWAVITVEDLPDHGAAGRPLVLEFMVRQHGVTPLEGLRPRIEARSGNREVAVPAVAGKKPGHYSGRLVLPSPGSWTITIHSGFGTSRSTLMPIEITASGAALARPPSEGDRGQRLFVAKGCASCHVHAGVNAEVVVDIGPELTHKRYQPDYLTRYLADPAIAATNRDGPKMPNLGLKPTEIASLVAFLNAERQASSGH